MTEPVKVGFERSIANVTTFSLGALAGTSDWSDLARNLAWTVPGNIVGGALVVGLGYGWLGHLGAARVTETAPALAVSLEPELSAAR